jgi:hypothetical protein
MVRDGREPRTNPGSYCELQQSIVYWHFYAEGNKGGERDLFWNLCGTLPNPRKTAGLFPFVYRGAYVEGLAHNE